MSEIGTKEQPDIFPEHIQGPDVLRQTIDSLNFPLGDRLDCHPAEFTSELRASDTAIIRVHQYDRTRFEGHIYNATGNFVVLDEFSLYIVIRSITHRALGINQTTILEESPQHWENPDIPAMGHHRQRSKKAEKIQNTLADLDQPNALVLLTAVETESSILPGCLPADVLPTKFHRSGPSWLSRRIGERNPQHGLRHGFTVVKFIAVPK